MKIGCFLFKLGLRAVEICLCDPGLLGSVILTLWKVEKNWKTNNQKQAETNNLLSDLKKRKIAVASTLQL